MAAEDEEERPAPKQVVRMVALLAASMSTTRGNKETAVISRAKRYEKYIEEGRDGRTTVEGSR